MKEIIKSHHPKRHIKSVKYAVNGLFHTLLNEPNFRIQILFTLLVVFIGFFFNISLIEWGLVVISLGLLLCAEMINTIVENFIDVLIQETHEGAKIIKDVSAGFVLITAIITIIILGLVFYHPVVNYFLSNY